MVVIIMLFFNIYFLFWGNGIPCKWIKIMWVIPEEILCIYYLLFAEYEAIKWSLKYVLWSHYICFVCLFVCFCLVGWLLLLVSSLQLHLTSNKNNWTENSITSYIFLSFPTVPKLDPLPIIVEFQRLMFWLKHNFSSKMSHLTCTAHRHYRLKDQG